MALLKLKCASCGKVFEELCEIEKIPNIGCPDCGGDVARAYEGKALFGQVKQPENHCESCPHQCMNGRH